MKRLHAFLISVILLFILFSCSDLVMSEDAVTMNDTTKSLELFIGDLFDLTESENFKKLLVSNLKIDENGSHSILARDLLRLQFSASKQIDVTNLNDFFGNNKGRFYNFSELLSRYPNLEISLVDKWNLEQLDSIIGRIPIAYSVNEYHKVLGSYPSINSNGDYGELNSKAYPKIFTFMFQILSCIKS